MTLECMEFPQPAINANKLEKKQKCGSNELRQPVRPVKTPAKEKM
jgi:hypothetical protein